MTVVFRDSTQLTKWTRWVLYSQLVITLVAIISGSLEYDLLTDFRGGAFASESDAIAAAETSDNRQQGVGIVQFIITIVSAVVILRWIHRANVNARQLGASGMRFTPGWSVGWYFVPIVTLWKPYQAMAEIWKASANPSDWQSERASPMLGVWWLLWLVSNALGQGSWRMSLKAEGIDELIAANVASQLADATVLPLCIVFVLIVTRIHDLQRYAWARIQGTSVGDVPSACVQRSYATS